MIEMFSNRSEPFDDFEILSNLRNLRDEAIDYFQIPESIQRNIQNIDGLFLNMINQIEENERKAIIANEKLCESLLQKDQHEIVPKNKVQFFKLGE